jgi:hypothetical protein
MKKHFRNLKPLLERRCLKRAKNILFSRSVLS